MPSALHYRLEFHGDGFATVSPLDLGPWAGERRETVPEPFRIEVPADAKAGDEMEAIISLFGPRSEIQSLQGIPGQVYSGRAVHPFMPLILGDRKAMPGGRGSIVAALDGYLHRVLVEVGKTGSVMITVVATLASRENLASGTVYGEITKTYQQQLLRRKKKVRPAAEYLAMGEDAAARAIADDFDERVNNGSTYFTLISSPKDKRIIPVPLTFSSGSEAQLRRRLNDIVTAYALKDAYGKSDLWPLTVHAKMKGRKNSNAVMDRILFQFEDRGAWPMNIVEWSDAKLAKKALGAAIAENIGSGLIIEPADVERLTAVDLCNWRRETPSLKLTIERPSSHERLEAAGRVEEWLSTMPKAPRRKPAS